MNIDELICKLRSIETKADASVLIDSDRVVYDVDKVIVDDTGDVRLLVQSEPDFNVMGSDYTKARIRYIADYYGKEAQSKKLIEELSELIRALVRADNDNITEEIADVEIMIAQIKYLYTKSCDDIINFKLDRQIGRIEQEINKKVLDKMSTV